MFGSVHKRSDGAALCSSKISCACACERTNETSGCGSSSLRVIIQPNSPGGHTADSATGTGAETRACQRVAGRSYRMGVMSASLGSGAVRADGSPPTTKVQQESHVAHTCVALASCLRGSQCQTAPRHDVSNNDSDIDGDSDKHKRRPARAHCGHARTAMTCSDSSEQRKRSSQLEYEPHARLHRSD